MEIEPKDARMDPRLVTLFWRKASCEFRRPLLFFGVSDSCGITGSNHNRAIGQLER